MSNVPTGCMFFIARSHIAARGVLTLAIEIAFYLDNFSGVPLMVFFGVSLLHDNSSWWFLAVHRFLVRRF